MDIFKRHNPAVLREILESDFLKFQRVFFKLQERHKFYISPHHLVIARALERVYYGDIKRLVINIPPGFGKTQLAVIGFISWCLAKNKNCKFIHSSYSDDLALLNSTAIKDTIESDEFQYLWPTQIRPDMKSKKRWNIVDGGGLYAVSSRGQVTGFRAGKPGHGFQGAFITDDPIKVSDAYSDTKRQEVNTDFNRTVMTRLMEQRKTPIIVIMQRIHEDDLSGFLLNGGSGEMWHHLCLPALID